MYVFKNMSAEWLFLLSVVCYPLLAWHEERILDTNQILLMCGFFYFLEMSFEILYDFKDIDGDRKEGVRTYPVVHGERIGRYAHRERRDRSLRLLFGRHQYP